MLERVIGKRPQADRILVAKISGEAEHHAKWGELTADEEAAAVAALRELAGGHLGRVARSFRVGETTVSPTRARSGLGFGTPGTIDRAGVMPGGAPSPMLLAFTKVQTSWRSSPVSRARQAGSSAAVPCWNGSASGGPRTMRTGKRAPKPDPIALQGAYGCLR